MTSKYLMISMEDEQSKHLADVLGNKTAKKIIDLLAEKELSENDIAKELEIPINTAEYNIQKLIAAGLIEKAKDFFWSVKGKKIPIYKISNKYIVIAPKKKFRFGGLMATLIASGLIALGIRSYELTKTAQVMQSAESFQETIPMLTKTAASIAPTSLGSIALWFLGGALFSLAIYLLITKIVRRSD
jgi:DNA-binding transcriptional ArsR family regulator